MPGEERKENVLMAAEGIPYYIMPPGVDFGDTFAVAGRPRAGVFVWHNGNELNTRGEMGMESFAGIQVGNIIRHKDSAECFVVTGCTHGGACIAVSTRYITNPSKWLRVTGFVSNESVSPKEGAPTTKEEMPAGLIGEWREACVQFEDTVEKAIRRHFSDG